MVRVLFDTSVLVASLWVNHPQHSVCLFWLEQVKLLQVDGFVSTHTLAELYSVLTRLPIRPQMSPQIAQKLIAENLDRFEVIPLFAEDYQTVIHLMVTLNLTINSETGFLFWRSPLI